MCSQAQTVAILKQAEERLGQLAAEKEALEKQLSAGGTSGSGGIDPRLDAATRRVAELEAEKALAEKLLVSLQLQVQRLHEEVAKLSEEEKHRSPHDVRELFEAKDQADGLRKKTEHLEAQTRQQASEAAELRRSLAQWRQHAESATEQASQARASPSGRTCPPDLAVAGRSARPPKFAQCCSIVTKTSPPPSPPTVPSRKAVPSAASAGPSGRNLPAPVRHSRGQTGAGEGVHLPGISAGPVCRGCIRTSNCCGASSSSYHWPPVVTPRSHSLTLRCSSASLKWRRRR